MSTGEIRMTRDGAVCRLVISHPERRNAMSLAMWQTLGAMAADAAGDPAVRAIVLSGDGDKAFVSGADIARFDDELANLDAGKLYGEAVLSAVNTLQDCAKPVIAKIQGFCIGGGVALAISCDLRIASDTAVFAIPAARLGIGYNYDGIRKLVETVGAANARQMMFTAERLSAETALRIGLVGQVVPADNLDAEAEHLIATVAGNSPLSIAASKCAIAETQREPNACNRDAADALARLCLESEDYREGRRAFLEKRPPRFQGR